MDLSNENIIHVKKDGIQYIQFRKLLEYKDIITHAFSLGLDFNFRTTHKGGIPVNEEMIQKVNNDYNKLTKAIGCDFKNIVKPIQEHTGNVMTLQNKVNIDKPDINVEKYKKTDGTITNKSNIILASTSADCILLLFFDPVKKVIANTHSGWKGTIQRIAVNTVRKMVQEYGCNPKDIICCICPSIRKCHFQVRKDVEKLFRDEFKDLQEINEIIEEEIPNETWKIDTVEINKLILKNAGLKPENIIDSGLCSVCNSNLIHSYRAEKEQFGLNSAVIELL